MKPKWPSLRALAQLVYDTVRACINAGINKVMKNKNASPALVPLWPPLVLLAPECSSYIFDRFHHEVRETSETASHFDRRFRRTNPRRCLSFQASRDW